VTDINDYYEPYDEADIARAEEPPEEYLIEEAERHARIHRDQDHGGGECDCPSGPDPWELPEGETYDTESPF
jgi:hypothetical protein